MSSIIIGEKANKGFQSLSNIGDYTFCSLTSFEFTDMDNFERIERHNQTDEMFVLVQGKALLLEFPNGSPDETTNFVLLELNKPVLVPLGTWHGIVMKENSLLFIVERQGTTRVNSEYSYLKKEEKEAFIRRIKAIMAQE